MLYKDIKSQIKDLAATYVPEWSLNEKDPDMGTAFALTYAEMMEDSIERYHKIMEKHQKAFVEYIDLQPLPSQNSSGYITFQLSDNAEQGEYIAKDTILYSKEQLPFLTEKDLYITPSCLKAVYCTYGREDKIFKISDGTIEKPWIFKEFDRKENLQSHGFYICHNKMFEDLSSDSVILLNFELEGRAEDISNPDVMDWFYYSKGFVNFTAMSWKDNRLSLKIDPNNPFFKTELYGIKSYFIYCRPKNLERVKQIQISKVQISVYNESETTPAHVFHRDEELMLDQEYKPFGSTLFPGDDFYIACGEIFSKQNTLVTMSVEVGMEDIEIQNVLEDYIKKMLGGDLKKLPIEITQISMEYWNGMDFVKLNTDSIKLFEQVNKSLIENKAADKYIKKEIRFQCPQDIEKSVINGMEDIWIRIRIREVSNLYQGLGTYKIPWFKNMKFSNKPSNSSDSQGVLPDKMIVENNLTTTILDGEDSPGWLFQPFDINNPCIFLGFDKPFGGNPIGILLELNTEVQKSIPPMNFSILTKNGWKKTEVLDGTDHLSHTGIIRIPSDLNAVLATIFNEELCWIRAEYLAPQMELPVCVEGFFINATTIIQQEGGEAGNCLADTITQMALPVGLVQKATNPFHTFGACNNETIQELYHRTARTIRHRGRAVTCSDFEALAYEAAGILLTCKCYEELGKITLVYVPKQYENKNKPSAELSKKIQKYLLERGHPILSQKERLIVKEAVYLPVSVDAEIVLKKNIPKAEGKAELEKALVNFLDPIYGNIGDIGYQIGIFPDWKTLYYFLDNQVIVEKVKRFSLLISDQDVTIKYALPVSGKHYLEVSSI